LPGPNALYTLAPSVPEANAYRDCLFSPFTRFGKHGDRLATSGIPFKCPILMADEGAVLVPKDGANPGRPYVGRAVRHISKSEPRAVAQGYAPVIPFKLEKIP
jgi:CRISPR-associated protein Csm4